MNVKIVFLYNNIKKTIYMIQFTNFEIKNKKNKICKLIKTLYDLKQFSKI